MQEKLGKIRKKALKSAKWMLMTSIISILCSYLLNIFLGKISPETLGIYSATNIFISSVATFIGMGGATVLSNFLPKIDSNIKKTQLIYFYTLVSFGMYFIFLIVLLFFPKISILLSGNLRGSDKYIALFIVAPIFIMMSIISYILVALLEARISNIMNKFYTILLSVVVCLTFIFNKELLEKKLTLIIFISLILANLFASILGIYFIKKEKIISRTKGFYVPKGFLFFMAVTFLQSLLSFLYKNVDKMFLISLKNIGQLGFYQAIISIVTLVEFIPSLLGNITIPYFSNIIRIGNKNEVEISYEYIEKYMLFFLISCIIGVISFSDLILNIFGKEYVSYKYLLIILLTSKGISSLGFTNTPMLISLEKNWTRLINSILQIFLQLIITILTINSLGILGVVLGRVIGVCFAQIIPQVVIKYKSGYNIKITKTYFCGIANIVPLGIIHVSFELSLLNSIILGIIFWIIFLISSGFKKKDFENIVSIIKK